MPSGCCLSGSDGEVILGVEISGVVVLVNLAYLLEEVGEGPDASIVHQHAVVICFKLVSLLRQKQLLSCRSL